MNGKRIARHAFSAAVFLAALWVVFGELHRFSWSEAAGSLARLQTAQIALALLATAGSYAALAACDALATRAKELATAAAG